MAAPYPSNNNDNYSVYSESIQADQVSQGTFASGPKTFYAVPVSFTFIHVSSLPLTASAFVRVLKIFATAHTR